MSAVTAHPSAIIDPGATIGDGTRIWHFSHICAGAEIGANCSLGQNVFVAGGARIGAGSKIQNNVSIFDGVVLAEDVFVGPSAVFTNVRHPRAHVSRRSEYGATRVGRGASIGANATIVCGSTAHPRVIGEYALVGAGSVVTCDLRAHALVVGNPARQIGWVCACGERLDDDLICARCANQYRLAGEQIERVPAQ
ncbi:acyltransferase [Bradymonas sediminis]|uniref:N-acetyltransferase n=1 Tax=Bradymonas sediminis TaxID=1548548 RepID=A0A2Z4FP88_9DELT|nr:acyltransferase [Bradymonas sediminis]AWV90556.1 N-acetyltransferase [Bradymonas sediminis]TDP72048.1 UDP-2-acetamido-3-amino-2,3-dideoxy-glucuronate N-acetyltransferase [Bradymonas sediminis]